MQRQVPVTHKETRRGGIFFTNKDDHVASELTYIKNDNVLTIDHTETKVGLEGKGLASHLVEKVVEFARNQGYKINPLCPFAEVQFDRNPGYRDVLA